MFIGAMEHCGSESGPRPFQSPDLALGFVKTKIWNYLPINNISSWVSTQKYQSLGQCSGSMTFWCGSGSGPADPCLWLMDPDPDSDPDPERRRILPFSSLPWRCQQKTNFFYKFFLHSTFWRYFNIIFQRQKVKKSHKTVEIKVFLSIFA